MQVIESKDAPAVILAYTEAFNTAVKSGRRIIAYFDVVGKPEAVADFESALNALISKCHMSGNRGNVPTAELSSVLATVVPVVELLANTGLEVRAAWLANALISIVPDGTKVDDAVPVSLAELRQLFMQYEPPGR